MSHYTLSLLHAGHPDMDAVRIFASSVYMERHEAVNTSVPDWSILMRDEAGDPCASFSVFDPDTHSPLFFECLFENDWKDVSRKGSVAEAGALAVSRRSDPLFATHAPIVLAGALFLGMEYMGYSSFVCVVNRLVTRLTRSVGASATSFGVANPDLLPVETARAMSGYFSAKPCGYEVGRIIDTARLASSFEESTRILRVDHSPFTRLYRGTSL